MRLSVISAALVAALVGYGSTIALVLAAAAAVGASPGQTASWVAAICFAKAVGSAGLSLWARVPVVLAWSTPGAALIATTTGFDMAEAAGAFVVAGLLIALTGLVPALGRLVNAIPVGIASALLAGVLLPFSMAVARHAADSPALVLPLVGVFLIVRLFSPVFAALAALATGLALAFGLADIALPPLTPGLPALVLIRPAFSWASVIGLGLPLFLVTMASQNLPGFAVMRAHGFVPPVNAALGVTGLLSAVAGLFCAHPVNMAAITAAICMGDDVHPNREKRWQVGLFYAGFWLALGLLGPMIIPVMLALPPAIIASVAGLALIAPFISAAAAAVEPAATRYPAALTLIVTASGVAAFGIGAAFWGLMAGLAALTLDHARARLRPA